MLFGVKGRAAYGLAAKERDWEGQRKRNLSKPEPLVINRSRQGGEKMFNNDSKQEKRFTKSARSAEVDDIGSSARKDCNFKRKVKGSKGDLEESRFKGPETEEKGA